MLTSLEKRQARVAHTTGIPLLLKSNVHLISGCGDRTTRLFVVRRNVRYDDPNNGSLVEMATKRSANARPRVATVIEEAILQLAFDQPAFGQDRVARELRARRLWVSASGVRYVWQRHGIETLKKRVRFVEARLRSSNLTLTAAQIAARERVRASLRSRRVAASIMGDESGEFRRSEYILTVAASLFREQGYDATSLRDIARRAGIPVGSLYYHFPSRDALFAAVYEKAIERVTQAVTSAVEVASTPWDRLQAACAAQLRLLCEPDDFAIAPLAGRIPSIEPRIRARLIALNDHYEDIYRALVADLDLPAAIHPSLVRLQILGAVIWTSEWYKPGKATPDEIAANLVNTLRLPLDQTAHASMRSMPVPRRRGRRR